MDTGGLARLPALHERLAMSKEMKKVKNVIYLVLCVLAFAGMSARAGEASYTTNTPVELTGTFGVDVGLDANDKKEYYYYVKLDQPIDVADAEYGQNETRITKIQLAIPFQFYTRPYKGKRITVKGTLFHSFTAHHHTKILMTVDKVGDLRLVGSP